MRTVTDGERRARLGIRHCLAAGAAGASTAEIAERVVALHSTDPATVYLSVAARHESPSVEETEDALYRERSVLRILGMRRTVFVVARHLAPVIHAACTAAIARRERARLAKMLEAAAVTDDGERWVKEVSGAALGALLSREEAFATELARDVPALKTQFLFGEGKKWEGLVGLSTRILFLLAADGLIVRGRPRGSWTSTQYRWASMAGWTGAALDDLPTAHAQAELARRWLAAYGPGTLADLKWWAGWTAAETKRAIAGAGTVEVALEDGTPAFLLDSDLDPVPAPRPWAALLPALDPTPMGWPGRAWFLGGHGPQLFDRSGNIGPTVWWAGRVVGGWAQRPTGEVAVRLLEDPGRVAGKAIAAATRRLEEWLGERRVRTRFGTPLERELIG